MFYKFNNLTSFVFFFSLLLISYSFGQIDTTLYNFNRLIIYGTGSYNIVGYTVFAGYETSQAIEVWGCGTTDRDLLQKNIELRFTGEYDTPYLLGNLTIHPIKDGTGSIATLVGARQYEIKDHPLNPNPGSNEYFNVRIPFEVWDADANEQINVTIYDRLQNVTSGGDFYAFNPKNRMYTYFLHKPYSETVADVDTSTSSDCQYLTWTTVFYETDWQTGDEIYLQYFNSFGNNTPPVAQFSISKNDIILGDSIFVDASESIDDNRLEYKWDISSPISWANNMDTTFFEHAKHANIKPFTTGEYQVNLTVFDGFVESNATKLFYVKPKLENILLDYSFIDTSWFRTNNVYFHDNKLFVAIEPMDVIRIYDLSGDSISVFKDINIADVIRVYAIQDDLMYVGIPGPWGGYWGPGALSIYRLEPDWSITPVLENYVPGTGDIFGMTFTESHTIVRDNNTIFNIDFETNPASPQIIAQREYSSYFPQHPNIAGQYLYVGNTFPERKIEILERGSLEHVSDMSMSPDWRSINVDGQFLFVGYKDSLQIYNILTPLEPIKLNTIKISYPFDWLDENYHIGYYGKILNANLLVVQTDIGLSFFDISNALSPELKGYCYGGRNVTTTFHKNNFYYMGNDIVGSLEKDKYFGLNKINLDFLTSLNETHIKSIPIIFVLNQNYPNPFNPRTKINYSIPKESFVSFMVFNSLGEKILELVKRFQSIGNYEIDFNGTNLSSGVYYFRLQAGDFVETKKMVLLK